MLDNSEHFEHNYNTPSEHSYSRPICHKCSSLEAEIIRLRGQLSYERRENGKLRRKFNDLLNPDPEFPKSKKICEDITKHVLKLNGNFSKGASDIMVKTAFSKKVQKPKS